LAPDDPHDAPHLQRAPDFQLTLTRALLETLDPGRILYVILSGITAGDGLGFNRAFLLLADEGDRALRGHLAIGPESRSEASRIWEAMEAKRFDLARVMASYDEFLADPRASRLVRLVENLSLPLPLEPGKDIFQGLLNRTLTERRPLMVNGMEVGFTPTPLALENFALAPLLAEDRTLGVIVVDNRWSGRAVTESALDDLQSLANLAAVAVERARLHERIKRMAEQDGLTGLLNRRRFDDLAQSLFAECRQHGEDLSLLLLDVDRFKSVNDRQGHLAGDDLLRGLAALVRDRVRRGDVAARYGGDELAIILPRASGEEARRVAEELARAARGTDFAPDPASGPPLRATISIGVATAHPGCQSHTQLLQEADKALYAAKEAGRDRVVSREGHRVPELPRDPK
jgi:diguanylate cyclase (GGDEF)-like protein